MSTIERNKGTLVFISVGQNAVNLYNEAKDIDVEHRFLLTAEGKLYKYIYDVEAEEDCSGFVDIIGDPQSSQDLQFHSLHYNGGGSIDEILSDAITRKLKL